VNVIRALISLFILVVIALAIAGWLWAGSQPASQSAWARAALAGCVVAGVVGLVAIWRVGGRGPAARNSGGAASR
jgi:hypothetical protein